jgi:hypothetical protein
MIINRTILATFLGNDFPRFKIAFLLILSYQVLCLGLKALVGDLRFLTSSCRSCDSFKVWFSSFSFELSLK